MISNSLPHALISRLTEHKKWPLVRFLGLALVLKACYSLLYRTVPVVPITVHMVVTEGMSSLSALVLSAFYPSVGLIPKGGAYTEGFMIVSGQKDLIFVGHPCNALDPLLVALAFVAIWPSSLKSKTAVAAAILLIVPMLNILRIAALAWLYQEHPAYFPSFHKGVFQYGLYAVIFGIWMWWLARLKKEQREGGEEKSSLEK